MQALSASQKTILSEVVDALSGIDGVQAVALGGSHARGLARPDSDLDVGIYYRAGAPFSVATVRSIAAELNDAPDPVVTDIGEWGPWVDGGAWLTIRGQRVDLLYRSVERIDRVILDAEQGRHELHFGQQPPFGFFGPTYLGEVAVAVPYLDPDGVLASFKERVAQYPDPLRRAVIQDYLWAAEFGLTAFAPKFAHLGDAYGTVGCLARSVHHLTLVLFALNRVYLLNDKTALLEIERFALAPSSFRARVQALLGQAGETADALQSSVGRAQALFRETAELAGDLYRRNRLP